MMNENQYGCQSNRFCFLCICRYFRNGKRLILFCNHNDYAKFV